MKHIFSDNKEIAHLWFHEAQSSARNPQHNFYFEGDTIYSYGSHFPVARIVRPSRGKHVGAKTVLITTSRHSVTTAKHVNVVNGAIRRWDASIANPQSWDPENRGAWVETDAKIFNVVHPGYTTEQLIGEWDQRITKACEAIGDTPKGTRQATKLKLFEKAIQLIGKANEFAEWFGVRRRWTAPASLDTLAATLQAERKKAAAHQAKMYAKRAKELEIENKKQQKEEAAKLTAWLDGRDFYRDSDDVERRIGFNRYNYSGASLRINPKDPTEVETTQGARFPLSHALKAIRFIRLLNGAPWWRNGSQIHLGVYQIDSIDAEGTIRAGCHLVTRAEFVRFSAFVEVQS